MLGSLLFTFSSFNLLHFLHPNAVAVIAHIPWLLWAIDIALLESRRRRVALAGVLVALLTGSQLLLGYPQYVWFSFAAEFSYAIFLLTAHKYSARTGCDLRDACDHCVGCTTPTWPRPGHRQGHRAAARRNPNLAHARCLGNTARGCRAIPASFIGDHCIP